MSELLPMMTTDWRKVREDLVSGLKGAPPRAMVFSSALIQCSMKEAMRWRVAEAPRGAPPSCWKRGEGEIRSGWERGGGVEG